MNTSETINEIAAALAKAQGSVVGASKDAKNLHFGSRYATLASILDACRKSLSENGIAIVQSPETTTDGTVTMVTLLCHASGQWMRSELTCRPMKVDAQGIGSVVTYLRRYALAAMVGVAPDDDDDGNAASGTVMAPAAAQPSRAVQSTRGTAKAAAPDTLNVPVGAGDSGPDWKQWAQYMIPERIRACRSAAEVQSVVVANADALSRLETVSPPAHDALVRLWTSQIGVLSAEKSA